MSMTVSLALLAIAGGGGEDRATPEQSRTAAHLAPLFTTEDYPAEALAKREQGTVGVRLKVSAEGRVQSCSVEASSGSSSLDGRTCAVIMERAKYAARRDSKGRSIAQTDSVRIRWVLPGDDDPPTPLRVEDSWQDVTVVIDDNEVRSCTATTSNGRAPSGTACEGAGEIARSITESHSITIPQPFRILAREEHIVGETVPRPAALPADERALFSLRIVEKLTVDEAGKVAKCESPPEAADAFSKEESCVPGSYQFDPLPAAATNRSPRYLVIVKSVRLLFGAAQPKP